MKYYCIGIKGTGLSALAQILSDLGNEVSGYDDATKHKFTEDGLNERHISIYYDGNHVVTPDTIVTYSAAIMEDHPELVRVRNIGCKIKKYAELMGDVIDMFTTIGVSGTHGKTTTTSIIRSVLELNGGCNYFVGAGDGYASQTNDYFVVESDEFNRHFTYYHPAYSIITNIETEHMECYKDIDDIRGAFEIFANQTKKLVVANGDNLEIKKINYTTPVIFFGTGFNNDVIIKNIKLEENCSRFDIYYKDELYGSFEIPLFGKHMVMDAAAAIILCKELGVSKDIIYNALKSFKNAKRRFAIEKFGPTTIIDDYAHHPTEIKVTLEAVRQKYPDKRIVVVFKPNTYSRTRDFKDEFVKALSIADKVYLTEIDCDREDPNDYPGVTSHTILSEIEGSDIISEETIDKLKPELNSVICIMGCAYVDGLINSLKKFIKEESENGNLEY